MPFGSTGAFTDEEWANGVGAPRGVGDVPRARRRRAVDARYRTIRSGRARALAGCPRAATARSTSASTIPVSSGCSRAGPATSGPTTSARSSAIGAALLAATARGDARRGGGRAPRGAHDDLVLQRHRRPSSHRTRSFAQQLTSLGCPTASTSSAAATTGRSGAATRRARSWRPREGSWRVEHSACPCCSRSRSRRPAGSISCTRVPGPRSATRCRSTSCRGTRRRRSCGSSSSGARPARPWPLRALGEARADDGRAAARARRRAVRIRRDGVAIAVVRQISLRDALDVAARLRPSISPPASSALGGAVIATAPPHPAARRSSSRQWSLPARCSTSCTRCCPATTRACSTR